MGDPVKSDKALKPVKFWDGVKAEFKKITWPNRDELIKQSIAVAAISIIIGAIIAILDFLLQYGVDFLTTFTI